MCTRFVFFVMAVLVGVSSLNAQGPGGQVPCSTGFYDVLYHESCAGNYLIPNLPTDEADVCVIEASNRCSSNNACTSVGRRYTTYNPANQNDWTSSHDYYAVEGEDKYSVNLKEPRKTFPCFTVNYCRGCVLNMEDQLSYCTGTVSFTYGIPDDELCPNGP